jgi:DNA replication and repair protein RecF
VIISSLRTAAFRNLEDNVTGTAAKNVFLVGENGQGKTNFLEALYFCAYGSSFRKVHDREIAQTEKKNFSAEIFFSDQTHIKNPSGEVLIKFSAGKKTVLLDGKKIEDRKDLLSVVPCIVFCHEDMEFVAGNPEQRRRFFDQVLSLYDPVYLDDLRCYRRVVKSRNSVLRDYTLHKLNGNPETLLSALDQQCVLYGVKLMEKRETAARLFSGIFEELYREVSGTAGVNVQYLPSWKSFVCMRGVRSTPRQKPYQNNNPWVVDTAAVADFLRERRAAEMAAGISLSGPHRDRYLFTLGEADFAATASTGQRRLLALLLRVAQARRFSEMTGRNPILLLDDVLLEMDGEKRRRFVAALPAYDQAFYTFLPEEPFQHYQKDDTLVYYVQNGHIRKEKQ